MRWSLYAVDTETLIGEIDRLDRPHLRRSSAPLKQYSQLDRAPYQIVDLRELLKRTLIMIRGKLAGHQLVRLRPRPAEDPGVRRRAQPGVDQHHPQRRRRDGRDRHVDDPHPPRRRLRPRGDRRHRPRHPPNIRAASSSRSSPPRPSARAPGWAWTSPSASSSAGTAATCASSPRPGDTRFQVRLPLIELPIP